MALIETIVEDNSSYTKVSITDDQNPGFIAERLDWKPGTAEYNNQQIQLKLRQAISAFDSNYTNWGTMSNAQKDAASKQAQRALAGLCRLALSDLSSPGV